MKILLNVLISIPVGFIMAKLNVDFGWFIFIAIIIGIGLTWIFDKLELED